MSFVVIALSPDVDVSQVAGPFRTYRVALAASEELTGTHLQNEHRVPRDEFPVNRTTAKDMPPAPRGRWDTTALMCGDRVPLDLELAVARYGLARAVEVLAEDGCLR